MFKKILIVNRGEIAVRIIKACRELKIISAVLYTDADKNSLHVRAADQAYYIGKSPANESYLNIPKIIETAKTIYADAIHPGYGFLSENSKFIKEVESAGITFIGPSSKSVEMMGEKTSARRLMKENNVPIVPGSTNPIDTPEEALMIAEEIGYPIMIKASAGGGGKGMRIVWEEKYIENAFKTASNEADSAFGNPELYLEKYIENPRHIEIQVMGDQFGNVYHYNERDCTVQRRHQKLIEESPSPVVSPELRKAMGDASIKGAKAVNYEGAGTIEYLVDKHLNFYFIEMNTRIQVEHPVTEMVNNLDLIKQQILVAAGQKIADLPKEPNGHAFEFRINAEDPDFNFRPSPGKIEYLHFPGGFGVRVDSHAYNDYVIPPYYDSLIAKLIVWGTDREHAISRAKRAFEEFQIEGIKTTIPFHQLVLENNKFLKGDYDTSFIDHLALNNNSRG